jgi:hypothetical protein
MLTGSPTSAFRRTPAAGEWNGATIVGHLADAELVYGVRLRTAITQPGGLMPAFDEELWAARFGPADDDPNVALARFRALREATIAIVESLSDEEWNRVGLHEEFGELSVRQLVDRLIAHDANHLNQLRTALG